MMITEFILFISAAVILIFVLGRTVAKISPVLVTDGEKVILILFIIAVIVLILGSLLN